MARTRILILGGTGDGFRLADCLCGAASIDVITSMAGRTPAPKVPAGNLRRGGFGGPAGLAAYLERERISAMIDATHPFAARMSRNAALAASTTGVPTVHIWRAGWVADEGDDWRDVDSMEAAVNALPKNAGLTFLTTGKTQLHHFCDRDDVPFLARVVSPLGSEVCSEELPRNLSFVYDKGPFDLDGELRLLREHGVQWIVSKNSGGEAAQAKLCAARRLGIPIIMVRRPGAPDGTVVSDVDAALQWVSSKLGLNLRLGEVTA